MDEIYYRLMTSKEDIFFETTAELDDFITKNNIYEGEISAFINDKTIFKDHFVGEIDTILTRAELTVEKELSIDD